MESTYTPLGYHEIIAMGNLRKQFNSREPTTSIFAYHCIGDKAKEILKGMEQPYQDISKYNIDTLRSNRLLSLFVFTDDAEILASDIDACIKQYKDAVCRFFILDLHSNHQYEKLKDRWEFYNIFTDKYCTLQSNILHYLLFFNHFIETHGLIGMGFCDIKTFTGAAIFITAGTATTLTDAIYPIPHSKNIRALLLGVELKDYEMDNAKGEMDVLASFFEKLPESVEVKWQISPKCGHPHTEYIVGFDEDPAWLADTP